MYLFKKVKNFLPLIIFSLLSTACVQKINKQGFVTSISPQQLSESFYESFPLKKAFTFGTIVVEEPLISINEDSKRITASLNLDFQTMFKQKILGNFIISGEPLFNKETTSIFLQNVEIHKLEFSTLRLGSDFSKSFLSFLNPMMNKIFKQYPIYEIPKESFNGRFIKDVNIEDSKF